MKNAHGVNIPDREQMLRDVEDKLVEQLHRMIRLVESRVHPDRIESEYAYTRNLISSRNTRYLEKQKEDRRHALA